jgi:hypothetical protein
MLTPFTASTRRCAGISCALSALPIERSNTFHRVARKEVHGWEG